VCRRRGHERLTPTYGHEHRSLAMLRYAVVGRIQDARPDRVAHPHVKPLGVRLPDRQHRRNLLEGDGPRSALNDPRTHDEGQKNLRLELPLRPSPVTPENGVNELVDVLAAVSLVEAREGDAWRRRHEDVSLPAGSHPR